MGYYGIMSSSSLPLASGDVEVTAMRRATPEEINALIPDWFG
jgi:hypothetical protein